MAQALKSEFPDIEIEGNKDGKFRIGSFELSLEGKLIHSKLETHNFPTAQEAAARIREGM